MRTQLAQVTAGLLVVGFLLWLTGVLHDVPKAALAAIVISATVGLFDVPAMTRLYRQDRFEFGVPIGTFAAAVALGILVGILTAVFLSLALLIARTSRPSHAVLGAADDGGGGFQEPPTGEHLEATPGVVVYRFDAPLFFANADYFVDHAIQLLDRAGPERFALDFEAVTLVDVTAARALKRLLGEVKSRDAELSVARASQAVHHQIDEPGLAEAIGESRFYPFCQGGRSRGRHARPALTATSGGRRRLTALPAGPAHRWPGVALASYQVNSISNSVSSSSTSNSIFRPTWSGTFATNLAVPRSRMMSLPEASSSAIACRRAAASSRDIVLFSFSSSSILRSNRFV